MYTHTHRNVIYLRVSDIGSCTVKNEDNLGGFLFQLLQCRGLVGRLEINSDRLTPKFIEEMKFSAL
jgi:hypothetical protein